MKINILLYPDFETLDVFGLVEVFGKVPSWSIQYYSAIGGIISNQDNVKNNDQKLRNYSRSAA